MPSAAEIADWVANYFSENQAHVADVLAGPKRETWFSSECFVALSRAAPMDDDGLVPSFSCWGEEQFTTMLAKVTVPPPAAGQPRRRPDVVCYLPQDGEDAIDAILELKLVLNNEDPGPGLEDLKSQLVNAKRIAPGSKALGLVFLAAAPLKTPGTFASAMDAVRWRIEAAMPQAEGFAWVTGHDMVPVFRTVYTGFEYPSMTVSLALGVVELAST